MTQLPMPLSCWIHSLFLTNQKGTGNITQANYCFTTESQSSQRRGDFSGELGGTNSPEILWPSAMNCPERAGRFLFVGTSRQTKKDFLSALRVSNESRLVGRVGGENECLTLCLPTAGRRYASS